jgi:hypothetical protein
MFHALYLECLSRFLQLCLTINFRENLLLVGGMMSWMLTVSRWPCHGLFHNSLRWSVFILISSVCIYPSSEEFVLFLHVRNTICDKMPELSATGALGRNERKSLGFLIVRLFVITSQKSTYGCWRCTGVHEGSWQCCLGEVDVCCMVYCVLVHSWLFCLHLSFSVYFSWSNHPWIRCWYNVFQRRLEAARYTHLIVEAHRKAVDIVLILLRVGLSRVFQPMEIRKNVCSFATSYNSHWHKFVEVRYFVVFV